MGLLDRVRNIVRANVNDAVNRAEDPVKALDQMIADWNVDLVKVRQAAALAMAAENRLQAEYDQRVQTATEWQRRAALAVDHGDDNLARQALGRKLQYQNEANQLEESIQAQSGHLDDSDTVDSACLEVGQHSYCLLAALECSGALTLFIIDPDSESQCV